MIKNILLAGTALACVATPAFAQEAAKPAASPSAGAQAGDAADSTVGLQDIVVTAQKRSQSINSVGMSITAQTGDALRQKGITDTADLIKAVPGFTFAQSPYSTPVYTLRGIGLYDYALGSSPSVAVYVDEVSLPFPSMGAGASLDLERVEVLKGPQGTLFGQSSTGGAINYIAASPTDSVQAGGNISYERFGKIDASGYISGPLTDTLKARLAVRVVEGGAWQESITRPNDSNGAQRLLIGRILLDWQPTDRFKLRLNVNGNRDNGDTQQPQLLINLSNIVAAPDPRDPYGIVDPAAFNSLTNPASPGYDASFAGHQNALFNRAQTEPQSLAFLGSPVVGDKNRLADWTPGYPHQRFDRFYQISLRGDYKLTDGITITSVTAYAHQKVNRFFDFDGTAIQALDDNLFGSIKSFNQELRLTGDTGRVNWLIGANYDYAKTDDTVRYYLPYSSGNEALPGLRYDLDNSNLKQVAKTYSVFANTEYRVTDHLTFQAGVRYTNSRRNGSECNSDPSVGQNLSKTFGNADSIPGFGFYDLQTVFGLDPSGHRIALPNQCLALDDTVAPSDPGYLRPTLVPFRVVLNEDNVSWRVGLNYKFDHGTLLFANVSTGYKAGIITGITPAVTSQYAPAKQEKVVAYEAGFKAPLAGRRLQLNSSVFYYDYSNKQVRARVRDPIFGLLEKAVNVPKSRIWGVEAELIAQPVEGLKLSMAGTYIKSKVTKRFDSTADGLPISNQAGFTGNFQGSRLPYTPTFTGVADGEYTVPVSGKINGFFGGTFTYHSKDNATFRNAGLPADDYNLKSYGLLDLRAGIAAKDDAWRLSVFARNVTNTFYVQTIFHANDTQYRYLGMPATYGLSLSVKMQ